MISGRNEKVNQQLFRKQVPAGIAELENFETKESPAPVCDVGQGVV